MVHGRGEGGEWYVGGMRMVSGTGRVRVVSGMWEG